jgi:Fe-S-cluster containining protein
MPQEPWYRNGLRFECTQCGNCCRNHGEYSRIYLAPRDVAAIAGHLGLSEDTFRERWCEREDGWTILRTDAPACPFLGEEGRCGIYPVRPKQCATWPFWEENLERAAWEGPVADCCPGLGKGPLYSREEIEGRAAETEAWYEGGEGDLP